MEGGGKFGIERGKEGEGEEEEEKVGERGKVGKRKEGGGKIGREGREKRNWKEEWREKERERLGQRGEKREREVDCGCGFKGEFICGWDGETRRTEREVGEEGREGGRWKVGKEKGGGKERGRVRASEDKRRGKKNGCMFMKE